MNGRDLSIVLGCVAGLVAALLLLAVVLLCRRWRRRRRKPLAEKERRLSVRTVKRHPLHSTVGVPVQPAEVGADLFLEQYERRHGQIKSQELLRAALSRSMEHLVLEPGAKPGYMPTVARDGGEESVSPSEQSSIASDEEGQGSRAVQVRPRLEFHVVYTAVNRSLTVCLNRLLNPPLRYRDRPFLVRLTVLGQQQESRPLQLDSQQQQQQQQQVLTFAGVEADWLDQGQLSCHLYVKRYSSLTEKLIGEGSVRLAELGLASGTPAACNVIFSKPGKKRTIPLQPSHTSAADEAGLSPPTLGQLLLSLRYSHAQGRMTVFLRRGENLPDSRGLVSPEFSVAVMLLKAGDEVGLQQSRRVSGRAPVWNQSFHFDIPEAELDLHWIQCIVMASKIYSKDRRVGFCQLGPDTSPSGAQHWEESLKPKKDDTPKWHPLLPAAE
ncbi:synaptotagmin-4-like [Amphibalanus amphitrite]|uniref:synaptotagmin-4-like n=1 Tax=Amphibalanus amphitrite TaxID=1232801 RepID=UPI001C90D2CF|nr:synaptotagmin-4-like [Amphibalanus amphitrite]